MMDTNRNLLSSSMVTSELKLLISGNDKETAVCRFCFASFKYQFFSCF